jgi:hypothetical protein
MRFTNEDEARAEWKDDAKHKSCPSSVALYFEDGSKVEVLTYLGEAYKHSFDDVLEVATQAHDNGEKQARLS